MANATTVDVIDANDDVQTVSTIDNTIGVAGTASAQVQTVQGIASMTPLLVTASIAAAQTLATVTTVGTVSAVTAISNALPAGNNNIGDVDVASLVPGVGATNLGKAIDTATGATDTGVLALATRDDVLTTLAPADGDNVQLRTDSVGSLWTVNAAVDKTLVSGRVINGGSQYETVAASQTAQVLGATGATGDYLAGILIVPATVDAGQVLILDNATSITIFVGGTASVTTLIPFFVPLGLISVSGAWKVTTGAAVSCIGIGRFTA